MINELWFKHITEKINLMTHLKCFTWIQRVPKNVVFKVCPAVNYNISINCWPYPLTHGRNAPAHINFMDSNLVVQVRQRTINEREKWQMSLLLLDTLRVTLASLSSLFSANTRTSGKNHKGSNPFLPLQWKYL